MPSKEVDGGLWSGQAGPVFLGIDPSLTGFAVTALTNDSKYVSRLYKSTHRGVDRLMDISLWLSYMTENLYDKGFSIQDVAIEGTVVASHSAVALGELSGTVRVALFHAVKGPGRYPLQVPPTMVKKYATDKGNAKKNEVMLAVYKKWGVEFSDDNMADSFVLANIASGRSTTAYEATVIDKLADTKFRDGTQL